MRKKTGRPTLKDLAKRLDLSPATISQSSGVSGRIPATIRRLSWYPTCRSLTANRLPTGTIVPTGHQAPPST